ncbi:MAG: hypothetical protein JW822_04980 [Spirochaetales bacterium]|nr:hypothetical protein [Spirochaetales bacterium]
MGKRISTAKVLLEHLFILPALQVKDVEIATGLSHKAANDLVEKFIELKILREITGNITNRNSIEASEADSTRINS